MLEVALEGGLHASNLSDVARAYVKVYHEL